MLSFLQIPVKKSFGNLIYWSINFSISEEVNLLVPAVHQEAIKA